MLFLQFTPPTGQRQPPEHEAPQHVHIHVDAPCSPVRGLSAVPQSLVRAPRNSGVLVRAFVESVRYQDERVRTLLTKGRWSEALHAAQWDARRRTLSFDDR